MNKLEDTTLNVHESNTRPSSSETCTSLQLRHSPGVTTEAAGERGEAVSLSGNTASIINNQAENNNGDNTCSTDASVHVYKHLEFECRDENSHDYCGGSSTPTRLSNITNSIYVHNDLIKDQHAESHRDSCGHNDATYSLIQTGDISGSNIHVYNDLMTDQEHGDKNLCEEDKYYEFNQTGDTPKCRVHVYNDLETDQELRQESNRENNDASLTSVMLSSNAQVYNELVNYQEESRAESQRDNSGYSDLHATSEVEIIVVGADAEHPSTSESEVANGYGKLTDEASNMYNEITDLETAANNPTSDTYYEIISDPYIDIDMVDKGQNRVLQYHRKMRINICVIVGITVVLFIGIVVCLTTIFIAKADRAERKRNTYFISTQRKLRSLKYSNVTVRNFFQGPGNCIRLISINIADGRLIAAYESNVGLLHMLTVKDSKAIVEKNLTMPARVNDAVWTTDGHIVCTIASQSVLRLTPNGDIVANNSKQLPTRLSVDADGVIYLADTYEGVYRSTDNGITWNSLLNTTMDGGWGYVQAMKVFIDSNLNTYDLWTVESVISRSKFKLFFGMAKIYDYRLRVYTVDKTSHMVQSWRNITLPSNISLASPAVAPHLACDDDNNVFLAEYKTDTIHLLSAKEGRYDRQLVNLNYFKLTGPGCLNVDKERSVMYVGLCWEQIAWLTLNYED